MTAGSIGWIGKHLFTASTRALELSASPLNRDATDDNARCSPLPNGLFTVSLHAASVSRFVVGYCQFTELFAY
jgi:hypothetical protein